MDTCFILPLLWVLGASLLAGILGWLLAKRKSNDDVAIDTSRELEYQNLNKSYLELKETSDNRWAGLSRQNTDLEEKVKLWKEKFEQIQLQNAGNQESVKNEENIKNLEIDIARLKSDNIKLTNELKSAKTTSIKKSSPSQKTLTKELTTKLKAQHKEEISVLKNKLKKTKLELKKAKKLTSKVREVEITKSIDIESLKKMLDKVPLKKVSERVIDRKSKK